MRQPSRGQTPESARRDWHALRAEEAVAAIGTDAGAGLAAAEAGRRLAHFGPNALPAPERRTRLALILGQLKSPLIYLLLGASALALAIGEARDAAVILGVVALNAIIGAIQEGRAEQSLASLRKLSALKARVLRDGGEEILEASGIVPGDIILLAAGDAVPADARLLDGAGLSVAEAALTGESVPVAKSQTTLPVERLLADRTNMLYAGTHVVSGRTRAVVIATGESNEIGRIAAMARGAGQPATPLELRIRQFGRYLALLGLLVLALVTGIGLWRGIPPSEILMVAVSQMVSLVPEGLPAAVTIALAVGVRRMAKRRTIVRRLSAVETLGSTTVICSDKTGTLTRNEMTVTELRLPSGRELAVTGVGLAPEGSLREAGRAVSARDDADLLRLLEVAVLCNDAELLPADPEGLRWRIVGDPTEAALLTLAAKAGVDPGALRARHPRLAELPFAADHKMMATQHDAAGRAFVCIKGAPEAVIERCGSRFLDGRVVPMDDEHRARARAAAGAMAGRSLRVLALGFVERAHVDGDAGFAPYRGRITFTGLVGEIDPPRAEVMEAVRACREAGIRPVMVTGDHKTTGLAIARTLGISRPGDLAIDGAELDSLGDDELARRLASVSVFARVHPAQKLRIVEAYQRRGDVVAMTGDGVNDAPALMRADVGVAMGTSGTEVAKEAAKLVITDDNFATLVNAVAEGRLVYRNIKKAILFLFSTSGAETLVLLLALLAGSPLPFTAVQILWNNLVTEGIITVNLIMESPEGDEMRRPPVPPGEPILTRVLLVRMLLMIPAITASALGWFLLRAGQGVPFELVRSETFTLLVVCEWFNVLNCRSETRSAFAMHPLRNPWLTGGLVLGNVLHLAVIYWPPFNAIFHTVPIGLPQFFALGAAGSLVLWIEELRKCIRRRALRRGGRGEFRDAGRPAA